VTANSAVASDGWWEQEHREQGARERYWRLPPKQLNRYTAFRPTAIGANSNVDGSTTKMAGHDRNNTVCSDSSGEGTKQGSG
jgi:hypothetical protein